MSAQRQSKQHRSDGRMWRPLRALFCALVVSTVAFGAHARDVTANEKAGLTQAVDGLMQAYDAGDNVRIIRSLPPRVLESVARKEGLPVDEFIAQSADGMVGNKGVVLESASLDVAKATYLNTTDGTPYALIPFRKIFQKDGQRIALESSALALMDGPTWYLVDLESPIVPKLLRTTYPSFADVLLPSPTITHLN